jgi:hypothetical protein
MTYFDLKGHFPFFVETPYLICGCIITLETSLEDRWALLKELLTSLGLFHFARVYVQPFEARHWHT